MTTVTAITSVVPKKLTGPYVTQANRDLFKQRLVQRTLATLKDQFPLTVSLEPPATVTFAEAIDKEIESLASPWLKISPEYVQLSAAKQPPEIPIAGLENENIQAGNEIGKLQKPPPDYGTRKPMAVVSLISEGTQQGKVFSVDVRVRQQDGAEINAVLKANPIYDPQVWLQLAKLNALGASSAATVSEVKRRLLRHANDWKNDAYVDAIIGYAGSRLVERGLSPFFPLVYETFRAFDTAWFSTEKEERYGKYINNDFPVQVILMQRLDGSFYDLLKGETDGGRRIPQQKCLAWLFQIVAGLATGQKYYGIVHNDLHFFNLLYEKAPDVPLLYYSYQGKTYCVPTFGIILKAIDFGRSSIWLQGKIIDAADDWLPEQPIYGLNDPAKRDMNKRSNDLAKIGMEFLTRWMPLIGEEAPDRRPFMNSLFNQWTSCEDGRNLVVEVAKCENRTSDSMICDWEMERMILTTEISRRCVNDRRPEDYIPLFDMFVCGGEVAANDRVFAL